MTTSFPDHDDSDAARDDDYDAADGYTDNPPPQDIDFQSDGFAHRLGIYGVDALRPKLNQVPE